MTTFRAYCIAKCKTGQDMTLVSIAKGPTPTSEARLGRCPQCARLATYVCGKEAEPPAQ